MAKFLNLSTPTLIKEAGSNVIRAYWAVSGDASVKGKYTVQKGKKKETKTGTCYKFKEWSYQWYYKPDDKSDWLPSQDTRATINVKTNSTYKGKSCITVTYSYPENAYAVKINAKAVWETVHKSTNVSLPKFKTLESKPVIIRNVDVPSTPSAPSVSIDINNKITVSVAVSQDEIATGTDKVLIDAYRSNDAGTGYIEVYKGYQLPITYNKASTTFSAADGHYYIFRVAYYNSSSAKTGTYTDWTDRVYSNPAQPTNLTVVTDTVSSVLVSFTVYGYADSYEIERATEANYLGSDTQYSQTVTHSEVNKTAISHNVSVVVDQLEAGHTYHFRVRAKGSTNDGYSKWSSVVQMSIGRAPGVPTTYSSKTAAEIGDDVNLYWVHNTQDGSSQTQATLELYLNNRTTFLGGHALVIDNPNYDYEYERDKTSVYTIELKTGGVYDTTVTPNRTWDFKDGDVLFWRVKTKGVFTDPDPTKDGGYGNWSALKQITMFAKPTAHVQLKTGWAWNPLDLTDDVTPIEDLPIATSITQYPFAIIMSSDPTTQKVISYNLRIKNMSEAYTVTDIYNQERTVANGEIIYQNYFDNVSDPGVDNQKTVIFYPSDVLLEDGKTYRFELDVYTEAGLTDDDFVDIPVSLTNDEDFRIHATIEVDEDNITTNITTYCMDIPDDGSDDDVGEEWDASELTPEDLTQDVLIDVYRLETDGTLTLIESGIENNMHTSFDRHPSLDYARYRVVARKIYTAQAVYEDFVDEEVGIKSLVIEWDDSGTLPLEAAKDDIQYSTYADDDDPGAVTRAGMGSAYSRGMLILPWNIDTSEEFNPDVSFIEYIGREHPVSYYGTQKGQTASWSTDIDKNDKETLYRLRRLARHMGDCYVREPSGTGYWANVNVSWSQTHNEPAVPVSIKVTRVEPKEDNNAEVE